MFGVWTLLAALLRIYCAVHINNPQLYNLTVVSFMLALGHFLLETFVYHTAALTIGIIVPLLVSGFSLLGMIIGYWFNPAFTYGVKSSDTTRNRKRTMKQELLLAGKDR